MRKRPLPRSPPTVRMRPALRPLAMAAGLGLAVLTQGCAGQVPTAEQIKEENHASRVAQIMRMANATRRGGDLRSAVMLYRRAINLAPESPGPLVALGATTLALGAYGQAAEAFRRAVNLDPANGEARRGFGTALIALDRAHPAAEQFTAAIALDATDHRAHNGLGVALDLLGEHDAAQQYYLTATKFAPNTLSLRNNMALSLALAGDYDRAARILREIAADPLATVRNRQNLALVYGLAGKTDKAAEIARMDLSEAEVRSNLAYYEVLRALSGRAKAAAVLGGHGEGVPVPAKGETGAPKMK